MSNKIELISLAIENKEVFQWSFGEVKAEIIDSIITIFFEINQIDRELLS